MAEAKARGLGPAPLARSGEQGQRKERALITTTAARFSPRISGELRKIINAPNKTTSTAKQGGKISASMIPARPALLLAIPSRDPSMLLARLGGCLGSRGVSDPAIAIGRHGGGD